MDWKEAQQQALDTWEAIRASIGQADTLDLLIEINSVFSLCQKAREEAAGDVPACSFCAFYQEFGGCRGIAGEMSERVVEKDWEGLRQLVDRFIGNLQSLRLPPEPLARPA